MSNNRPETRSGFFNSLEEMDAAVASPITFEAAALSQGGKRSINLWEARAVQPGTLTDDGLKTPPLFLFSSKQQEISVNNMTVRIMDGEKIEAQIPFKEFISSKLLSQYHNLSRTFSYDRLPDTIPTSVMISAIEAKETKEGMMTPSHQVAYVVNEERLRSESKFTVGQECFLVRCLFTQDPMNQDILIFQKSSNQKPILQIPHNSMAWAVDTSFELTHASKELERQAKSETRIKMEKTGGYILTGSAIYTPSTPSKKFFPILAYCVI